MAKHSAKNKLPKEQQQELLLNLCQALVVVRKTKEAANLLADLFSPQEIEMIAKRLQIAKLLIQGLSYSDIQNNLKVSNDKMARVSIWLANSGEGFRFVVEKTQQTKRIDSQKSFESVSWRQFKKMHPAYFWPQEALNDVLTSNKKGRKKRVLSALTKAEKKTQLYREIKKR